MAVRDGTNEILDLLIERGCDLDLPLPPYQRPLDFAVIIDDVVMVEKLVKGMDMITFSPGDVRFMILTQKSNLIMINN